jgi:hypothetical protein
MKELFATYPLAAWSVVSVMLAGVAFMLLWDKLKWWWHNTWYGFPLIGKIASLSRDSNRAQETGWFKAERTLCRDYKKFIRIQNEYDFNQKITYLTKAGDLGRKETPSLIWILTIAMVFVEAMGFSYVLAGYTLPGASENLQQTGAYGIAFLISVILVAFTHLPATSYSCPVRSSKLAASGSRRAASTSSRPASLRWPGRNNRMMANRGTPNWRIGWAPSLTIRLRLRPLCLSQSWRSLQHMCVARCLRRRCSARRLVRRLPWHPVMMGWT